jgi:protein CLEC16A
MDKAQVQENLTLLQEKFREISDSIHGLTSLPEATLIKNLTTITNIILTGEKSSEVFFEFFCECRLVELFQDILLTSRSPQINIAVIQNLTMFLYNYKKTQNIYYLLSNKNLAEIIVMDLDFQHNEFTDYYVNFLKTIGSKISSHPPDLFYNNIYSHFPLLYSITRFYNHHETLVRTTVQNVVLGLLKYENK